MSSKEKQKRNVDVGLRLEPALREAVTSRAKELGISRVAWCALAVDEKLSGGAQLTALKGALAEIEQRLFSKLGVALDQQVRVAQAERDSMKALLQPAATQPKSYPQPQRSGKILDD